MKKKFIIIIGIVVIVLVGIFLVLKLLPKNTKIDEVKTVHDIEFSNAKITKKKNKYIFSVTLNVNKDVIADNFDADIKNKKGKSLGVLKGYIGNMKKGDTVNVEIEANYNLKDAYEVTYTVNAK